MTANNDFNSSFEYAEMLKALSESINRYTNNFRDHLSIKDRQQLEDFSGDIGKYARTVATITGIELLKSLEPKLDQLQAQVKEINNFLGDVAKAKQLINTVSRVVDTLANIVKLIPPLPLL